MNDAPLAQLVECPAYTREVEGSRPSGSTKLCPRCGQTKYFTEFYRSSRGPLKIQSWCKLCVRETRREGYRKNPRGPRKYARDYNLKAAYDLSQADVDAMIEAQGGKCGICGNLPERVLNVDHCHSTQRVRGMLCSNCNHGLGHFRDNIEYLANAIMYLKTTR